MSIFPSHWPVEHPDRIQLYSLGTPNGMKAAIVLEELELPYEFHKVDFGKQEQHDPGYLMVNPNNKIPSIIDPDGPGGEPLPIMESGAILHYLASKTGQLIPADPVAANQVMQWMMFQVGSVGPMFGQYGHFSSFAPKDQDHSYALKRYSEETLRILGVIEKRLQGRDWIVDDYSIADIMILPWVATLRHYQGPMGEALAGFPQVVACLERFQARPAVKRGIAAVG